MVNKPLTRQLRKTAFISLATVFIAGFFVTILHEASHGLICNLEGNHFEYTIGLTGGIGQCFGDVKNVPAFLMAGGGIATSFSLMVAMFVIRYNLGLFIGFTTLAIGQFANMILEAGFYSFNMESGGLIAIQMIVLATWMILITYYVRREANKVKLTA